MNTYRALLVFRRLRLAALLPSLFLSFTLAIRADDEAKEQIAVELEGHRDEYKKANTKAIDALVTAFKQAKESIESNNSIAINLQIQQLEDLEVERLAFINEGKLPASKRMRESVEAFEKLKRESTQALISGLEKTIHKYRLIKEFDLIKDLLEEQSELKLLLDKNVDKSLTSAPREAKNLLAARDKLSKAIAGKRLSWDVPYSIILKSDGSGTYTKNNSNITWVPIDDRRMLILWNDSNDYDLLLFSEDKLSYDKRWLGNPGARLDSTGKVFSK